MALLNKVNDTGRETVHALRNLQASINLRLKLADAVQSAEVAIWTKDLDGTVQSWNSASERMLGWRQGEVVGKNITDTVIPPDRHEEEKNVLERIARGEVVEEYHTQRLTRSKRLIDLVVTTSPIRERTGKVIGASTIARPI
jgi:PAS domain S-box-containing protein